MNKIDKYNDGIDKHNQGVEVENSEDVRDKKTLRMIRTAFIWGIIVGLLFGILLSSPFFRLP